MKEIRNMKTKILACTLAMALLVLTGCAHSAPEPSQDTSAPDTNAPAGTPVAEGKTLSPLPTGIDPAHLEDCTAAVSFEQGDAYVDDTGAMQLKVKVYDYDLYDMADVSALQVGDKITFCQEDVEVTSLEREDDGTVVINGGLDNGGIELVSNDSTAFYASGFDDLKQYYELGEATVPVSADEFTFEDASDLDSDPVTYYPGDLLTEDSEFEYNFTPNNTTLTVQGGYAVHLERVYNP